MFLSALRKISFKYFPQKLKQKEEFLTTATSLLNIHGDNVVFTEDA